jgi:flap endonuclease-1
MGVLKFGNAFKSSQQPIHDIKDEVEDKVVALDLSLYLCAAIKAIHYKTQLTDTNGIPTAGINALFSNILMLRKAGVKKIIGVCDNKKPNPMKAREHKKRRAQREKAKKKAEESKDDDEKQKLCAQAWSLDDAVIQDAKTMMYYFGVEYHVAPVGREAEQYAADLAKAGKVDVVMSNDTDAIMFGAPHVLTTKAHTLGKTKFPYTKYELEDILKAHEISLETFQHMCIALGTDFAEKTPNVGEVTVFTRGRNKPLSVQQQAALIYVQSPPPIDKPEIVTSEYDRAGLIEWLVTEKNFNRERVTKRLR